MDRARDGVPHLTRPVSSATTPEPPEAFIDLHLHSTASDGILPPTAVVERAAREGLTAIALTDHDTLAGVPEAQAAGERLGVRVIAGCEFSVAAPWGEMHVLGYFLPVGLSELEDFLEQCRADRVRRGDEMVQRARALGVAIDFDQVLAEADGAAVGRPHVARVLVRAGAASDLNDAFARFIGRGRPAFVEKRLPAFRTVAELVHAVGGLVSAAHLKDRGSRSVLAQFQHEGLDALETRHPSHDPDVRARLTDRALALGLLRTGGSDWHGDAPIEGGHAQIGSQRVPLAWLVQLEAARAAATT